MEAAAGGVAGRGGGKRKKEVDNYMIRHGLDHAILRDYEPREKINALLSLGDLHLASLSEPVLGIMVPCKLFGIMAAGRNTPTVWSAGDLELESDNLRPRVRVTGLEVPTVNRECQFIEGEDDAASGRLLALKLREEGLI